MFETRIGHEEPPTSPRGLRPRSPNAFREPLKAISARVQWITTIGSDGTLATSSGEMQLSFSYVLNANTWNERSDSIRGCCYCQAPSIRLLDNVLHRREANHFHRYLAGPAVATDELSWNNESHSRMSQERKIVLTKKSLYFTKPDSIVVIDEVRHDDPRLHRGKRQHCRLSAERIPLSGSADLSSTPHRDDSHPLLSELKPHHRHLLHGQGG
jgi:hypothetical protein